MLAMLPQPVSRRAGGREWTRGEQSPARPAGVAPRGIRLVGGLVSGGASRPLPAGGGPTLATAALHGASLQPGPADGPHLAGTAPAAEEQIAAVTLQPRHVHASWHFEHLQDLSCSRIHSSQLALVTFPGAVPQLSVDPGDPGDEAVGLDRAQDGPGLGIDLIDLPVPVLPDPERPLGPREPRVTAAARRRHRGEHAASLRVDLLDAIRAELK